MNHYHSLTSQYVCTYLQCELLLQGFYNHHHLLICLPLICTYQSKHPAIHMMNRPSTPSQDILTLSDIDPRIDNTTAS